MNPLEFIDFKILNAFFIIKLEKNCYKIIKK